MSTQKQTSRSVRGPDGSLISVVDLPKPGERWIARRKAVVVYAVRGGLLSLDDAMQKYGITFDEFMSWQLRVDQHGLAGLRATRGKQYQSTVPFDNS